jgi:hypothetical protein
VRLAPWYPHTAIEVLIWRVVRALCSFLLYQFAACAPSYILQ